MSEFRSIIREFLEVVGKELAEWTTEEPVVEDSGEYGATLLTPSHVQFAKYGRGPGKQPPFDPLFEWVSRTKFQFRDALGKYLSYKTTAWIIVKSIGRKGTLNYKPNAPNAIEEAIENNVQEYYKNMQDLIAKTYAPELQDVYRLLYPKKIITKL